MNIFSNDQTRPEILAALREQNDKTQQSVDGVKGLTDLIRSYNLDRLLPQKKAENVTFGAAPYFVDMKGYPYLGLFVSAAQTVAVQYGPATYNLNLTAGFNQVVLPDQAQLTSNTTFVGLMMWSTTTFQ